MNRGPSPIFDAPEFPTLRRVKPLPKRRRTGPASHTDGDDQGGLPSLSTLGLPFPLPGPDATAEELIAHAESLSAHMALQSYYMPGLQDIFNRSELSGTGNGHVGYSEAEEGDDGEEDMSDHLQQPGNTKKRKVPANTSAMPGHDPGDTPSGGEEEVSERGMPPNRSEEPLQTIPTPSSPYAGLGIRKGQPPRITQAGLQHKETLKSRKRQLAAVLGALSHGDTLALDQALSSSYQFPGAGFEPADLRVRISHRFGPRLARAARFSEKFRHPDKSAFMESEFTFACPSTTAERLVSTKEEVAALRSRFEAELARQAAKAAKMAAANKLMSNLPSSKSSKQKRGSKTQTRARPTNINQPTSTTASTTTNSPTTENVDPATMMGIKTRGKKKKRSALANASNPHHLRNYVPSRLPQSGATNGASSHPYNGLGPLALRFLSADIPPRRRRNGKPVPMGDPSALTNPADEWICPFCEHDLFYGDEREMKRAVRSRKKILKRRRRARERAAAAASGTSTAKAPPEKTQEEYEMHPGYAPGVEDIENLPTHTKWRGDPGKELQRAGDIGSGAPG
ncbi:unnamed protein product [Mycena citricolor]|uniref:Uncharacterized protein n=1 Tax=Mycena citricolor TaxID=2018698 RepID=A0AAD2H2Z6_9AGAR|nr:unnamed protein product [Mycena citricolor]CAK5273539.1 unnamed protein product [Mycena citricolor]